MLRERLSVARVDFDAALADAAWASLGSSGEGAKSGWNQADAVQAVALLAILRTNAAAWGRVSIAEFNKSGDYLGTRVAYGNEESADLSRAIDSAGHTAAWRFGDSPIYSAPVAPGRGLPDDWHRLVAMACDTVSLKIAAAKAQPEAPEGYTPAAAVVGAPILLTIIVAGAAAMVVGAVAAWRALDPDTRRTAIAVEAAAKAYSDRLAEWSRTGTMPEPSPLETGALDAMKAAAKERASSDYMTAGAVVGGVVVGTAAAVALARYA